MLENWQSEYLQFTLYILATVWFLQRGSPESKEPGTEGRESDERQKIGSHASSHSPRWARVGGLRTAMFSNSLIIVMGLIWAASWVGQSITGRVAYNEERLEHAQAAMSYTQYIGTSDFWERTLQNCSPSSSRWARWRSSPSICASAARRSQSPSGPPTAPPAPPAEGG